MSFKCFKGVNKIWRICNHAVEVSNDPMQKQLGGSIHGRLKISKVNCRDDGKIEVFFCTEGMWHCFHENYIVVINDKWYKMDNYGKSTKLEPYFTDVVLGRIHYRKMFKFIISEMTDDEFDYPFEWLKIRSKYNLVNSKPILSNVSFYNLYRWKNYGWVEWSKGGMCGVVMGGNDNPFFQTNDIRIEKSILVGKAKKVRTLIEYIKK